MTIKLGSIGKIIAYPFSMGYGGILKILAIFGIRGMIAVFLVGIFLLGSIFSCVEEKSPMPFLEFVGSTLTASDFKVGQDLDDFLSIKNPDIVDVFVFFFQIFGSLYLMYVFFYVGFKVYDHFGNQSDPKFKKFKWVFFVLIAFHFIWMAILWLIKISDGEVFEPTPRNFLELFFPFTNTIRLIASLPYIYSFINFHKDSLLVNWFNPEVRYNDGVSEGTVGKVKGFLRFVGNFPDYVRDNLAQMKKDLFSMRK